MIAMLLYRLLVGLCLMATGCFTSFTGSMRDSQSRPAPPPGPAAPLPAIPPGTRVRIVTTAWAMPLVGALEKAAPDQWTLRGEGGAPIDIVPAEITHIDHSRGTTTRAADGASIGAMAGAGLGALAGHVAVQENWACCDSRREVMFRYGAIGGISAGLLGALIGLGEKVEWWEPIYGYGGKISLSPGPGAKGGMVVWHRRF